MTRSTVVLFYLIAQALSGCADEAPPPRHLPVISRSATPAIVPEQATVTVVPAPEPRGSLTESPISAPEQTMQEGAQVNQQSGPTVMISPEPLVLPGKGAEHRYQIAAERYAKENMCNPTPQASLQMRAPAVEVYAVACLNGDAMLIRCEFGNCREMQ